MPPVKVLEDRKDLYIIQTEMGVSTMPKTPYHEMKYLRLQGERIFHTFADGTHVGETYDDGIFNAFHDGKTMQISDAEGICKAILGEDVEAFTEIFREWYSIRVHEDLIKSVFSAYPHRVDMEAEPGNYVVDGVFMVDSHGAAHYRVDNEWKFVCIVSSGSMNSVINIPVHGDVKVSSQTMVIIAKIFFLLHPKSSDHVFFQQLTKEIQGHVKSVEGKERSLNSQEGGE